MKSKNLLSVKGLIVLFFLISYALQSQITFQGLINENEGAAAWNADGTGPEPFGDGHETFLYYAASRDYVDPASTAGSHVLAIGADFNALSQALSTNGFLPDQLKLKMGLASLGNDEEGIDWFNFGVNESYMNFYPLNFSILLNGEMMITGTANYLMFHYGVSTGWQWSVKSNFFTPADASGNSSSEVQNVAAAFLLDVGSDELQLIFETFGQSVPFSGNGRDGAKFNFSGTIEKGHAELPFQGLAADHEGFAGWDTDGTGPEPKRDGHSNQKYYIASRDYYDIDPDPNAGFAHMIDNGIEGFQNFALQLAYRGLTFEQVKIKMGLRDLGEDIEGEDWSYVYPIHHVNFYHSDITAEINGEKVFGFVCDTAKSYQNSNNPALGWWGTSAKTIIYDASGNSSADIQAVAMSFFKDLEQRQIQTVTSQMTSTPGIINTNGRSGGFWQINDAKLVAMRGPGTLIGAGNVSGNWNSSGHPYIITGDITIPDNQSLVIEPGVWVKFSDRVHFKVDGAIQAIGDTSNLGRIVFTAVNPDRGWGHFEFVNTPTTNDSSLFENCIFEYGYAPGPFPFNNGGAFAIQGFNKIRIQNCLFQHNTADLNINPLPASGGAIALWTASPRITNNIFRYNKSMYGGAIISYNNSNPLIDHNLFYGNHVSACGGALEIFESSANVVNNTFTSNIASSSGGAVDIYNSTSTYTNNIFWNNYNLNGTNLNQFYIRSNFGLNEMFFYYNDLQEGQDGITGYSWTVGAWENNIDADPEFVDGLALDFHIFESSPCHNSGDPSILDPDWTISDMGYCYTWCTTSIDESVSFNTQFSVFPNPVSENGTISYKLAQPSFVRIEMYNYLGQKVQELYNDTQSIGTHEIQFNAGNLKKGVYILNVTTKSHDHYIKFTKIN